MFSMADYESAKQDLAALVRRWENYSGNNPDKYDSDLKQARMRVATIEAELKERGLIPRSDREVLESKLDRAFPDAQSKEIVEFEGRRYRRRFYPSERSRSRKTVKAWRATWEPV